ncbi:MAG: C40 family peptidase [Candidatus Cohnella colombiensis]|uniref:C40 family peptidase n=1 Tax=Candidatus Cohnella colombiensis TaxID=3121368 RepID=A0AA95EW32_9BACL|nr:MAG: C40 family peptidase [Cohnella sp.]
MRKVSIMLFALAMMLVFSAGSAFAESKLDTEISKLIGVKYKSTGTTTNGFDCSGFTMYVFNKLGIKLPHASKSQATLGKKVAKDDLREGDLVFFNTNGKGISHVGVYVGDGKFAHASVRLGITINKLSDKYYVNKFVTARRVMDADTYESVATDHTDSDNEEFDDVE